MRLILTLMAVTAWAAGTVALDFAQCGHNPLPTHYFKHPRKRNHHKIMGGHHSQLGKHPWTVALVKKENEEPVCAGTLISPRHVVTAAHCLQKLNEPTWLTRQCGTDVRCRERLSGHKGHERCHTGFLTSAEAAQQLLVHWGSPRLATDTHHTHLPRMNSVGVKGVTWRAYEEFYRGGCVRDDLVVLELEEEVPAAFACLPQMVPVPEPRGPETSFSTLGWGSDPIKHMAWHDVLQELQVGAVLEPEICHMWTSFPRDDVCVRERADGNTCQGDSGAGLLTEAFSIRRTVLFGVLSFGSRCESLRNNVAAQVSGYTRLDFQTPLLIDALGLRNPNFEDFDFSTSAARWSAKYDS